MTATDLLWSLAAEGVRLRLDGSRLAYDADPGALTPDRRELILRHRADLVASLSDEDGSVPVGFLPVTVQQAANFQPLSGTAGDRETNIVAFHLSILLDPGRLEHAVERVVARHPLLRCEFRRVGDGLACGIHRRAVVPVSVETADELPDVDRVVAGLGADFEPDPGAVPPWRVHVVNHGGRSTIFLAMSYVISDGWSIHLLVDELVHFHQGGTEGELPKPGDFGAWASTTPRPVARTGDLPTQVDSGAVATRSRPAAFHRDEVASAARSRRTTLFGVLVAAYATAAAEALRRDEITIAVPLSLRNDLSHERIVGPLRHGVALRFSFRGGDAEPARIAAAMELARAEMRDAASAGGAAGDDLRLRFNFLDFSARSRGSSPRVAADGDIVASPGHFELKVYVWFDSTGRGVLKAVYGAASHSGSDVDDLLCAFERLVGLTTSEGGMA
ncbi:hypothetical protein SK854_33700 [Lentzea sp. BCCO 10_0061]|uniref:TubC N-terminal docking domain-containing protein n=1 Tax=Lentzea sokolovensis TaxID=3095429 RepID=A0ABU4V837_9PSEU|nr:hypothetical protein [Lentzea sp. BCCO 10_0061]MDX8147108.1 hypothetical protein [Lentzea sp. BCCO 10_0061]